MFVRAAYDHTFADATRERTAEVLAGYGRRGMWLLSSPPTLLVDVGGPGARALAEDIATALRTVAGAQLVAVVVSEDERPGI